ILTSGGATHSAGRSLCGGCVREFRPNETLAGGGGLFVDRIVRAGPDGPATGRVRETLHLDRRLRTGLFSPTPDSGPGGFRGRPPIDLVPLQHPFTAGRSGARVVVQVRC